MKEFNFTFKTKKAFVKLLREEAKASKELFRETKNPIYNTYATYCETAIYNHEHDDKEKIREIKFNSIKEFVLHEWIVYEARINNWSIQANFPTKDMSKYRDSLYDTFKKASLERLGESFFNTPQLQ